MIWDSKSIGEQLEKQRKFFQSGATHDVNFRLEALSRLEETLVKEKEAIMEALEKDLGKPGIEAFLAEWYFLILELRLMRKKLKRWLKPKRAGSPIYFLPVKNRVHLQPYGCALVVAPWNYPIQLSLAPLMAAVAAGNTVLLKPSEMTPVAETILTQIIQETFSPEHVSIVTGDVEVSKAVLDQKYDFIFFTGSTGVGKIVAAKAAENLTPTALELGGKCPVVVDETADLEIAARRILVGKLFNGGQTCFAPDFVLVQESVKDELIAQLKDCLMNYPWEEDMSHIVNVGNYERVKALISGEVIQKGEDRPDDLHLAPRILTDVSWSDPVMQEEIFGPLLPVLSYNSEADAVSQLQQLNGPLALYCFSTNEEFTENIVTAVPSGGVCINDVGKQASNLELPFGGVSESGMGNYRGKWGVETFSYQRSITRRYNVADFFEMLPPRDKSLELVKKWMR